MTEDDALDRLRGAPPAPLGDALKERILARARLEVGALASASAGAGAAATPRFAPVRRPGGRPSLPRLALAASVALAVAGGIALLAGPLAPAPAPAPSPAPAPTPTPTPNPNPNPTSLAAAPPAPTAPLSPDLLAILGEHVTIAGPFFRQIERLEGADPASDARLVRAELEATDLARRTCDLELKLHASLEPAPQIVLDYAYTCRDLLGAVDTIVTDDDSSALHYDFNADGRKEAELRTLPVLVRGSRVDAQIVGLNCALRVEPRPVNVRFSTVHLAQPDLVEFGNGRTLLYAGRAADANDCFASFATKYTSSPLNPYAVYWRDATANVVANGSFAVASDASAAAPADEGRLLLPLAVPAPDAPGSAPPDPPTSSGR